MLLKLPDLYNMYSHYLQVLIFIETTINEYIDWIVIAGHISKHLKNQDFQPPPASNSLLQQQKQHAPWRGVLASSEADSRNSTGMQMGSNILSGPPLYYYYPSKQAQDTTRSIASGCSKIRSDLAKPSWYLVPCF